MLCPKCNVDRGPGSKFCKDCGSKTVSPSKRCKNNKEDGSICDEIIEDDATFCSSCGNKIEVEEVFVEAEDDEKRDTVSSCLSNDNIPKEGSTSGESDSEEFEDALETLNEVENIHHETKSDKCPNNKPDWVKEDDGPDPISDQTSPTVKRDSVVNQMDEPPRTHIDTPRGASDTTQQMDRRIETDVDSFKQTFIFDQMNVHFHIIVPSDVKFQRDTDFVYLELDVRVYNGVKSTRIKMDYAETHEDANNSTEMIGVVSMEKSQIINSCITYRYFVERNSKRQNGTTRDDFWELCFMQGKENRYREILAMHLLQSVKNTKGLFHVYDGLVYNPKHLKSLSRTGLIQTVISSVGLSEKKFCVDIQKDADIVMKVFAKGIAQTWSRTLSGSDLVAVMTHMCNELNRSTTLRYLHGKDSHIVQQQMNQNFWKAFVDFYERLQESKSTEDRKRKLCILIVMIHIRRLIVQTDVQSTNYLASKFFVEVDLHNKRVYEWDILEKNFTKFDRDLFKVSLVNLVSNMTQHTPKSPCWWYLLPLIHFLSGECAPFEEVPQDVSHAAQTPAWWGFRSPDLESFKNTYKLSKRSKFSIVPFIRKLKDVFRADYYLPRAIIACCDIQDVKEVLDAEEIDIPFEVFYAAIAYFINANNNAELISDCLVRLIDHSQVQNEWVCETRLSLKAVIAGDMAYNAIQSRNRNLHHIESCTKLYLLSMAIYDNEVVNEGNDDGIKNNTISVTNIGCLVVKLKDTLRFKTLEDEMEFWNRMICPPFYIQSKRIQDIWNELITQALYGRISHSVVRISKSFDNYNYSKVPQ